ncbi:hypothetical protein [Flavobacterium cheonhonense]|nr:hypothetical protein [Flavobacterium cheonhonense]
MKKKIKLFTTTLVIISFVFVAIATGDSKNTSDDLNSSSNNSAEWHNCEKCGKKYQGDGFTVSSDGVGGPLSIDKGAIFTSCEDCAQKTLDRMNEARARKGY